MRGKINSTTILFERYLVGIETRYRYRIDLANIVLIGIMSLEQTLYWFGSSDIYYWYLNIDAHLTYVLAATLCLVAHLGDLVVE